MVMASSEKKKKKRRPEAAEAERSVKGSSLLTIPERDLLTTDDSPPEVKASTGAEADDGTPAQLGATKYVHAAYFAAAILAAYLADQVFVSIWNRLAEWPTAVRFLPLLLRYGEGERSTIGMVFGVFAGVAALWQIYSRRQVRDWADEVAIELSRVTWPTKEQVTNGTIVVLVASAVASIYVALLDRFWGFVTTLVYGA
jgi:preprotein translocase subunit SecE